MRRHLLQDKKAQKEFETLPFQTAEQRQGHIVAEAEYFTACRFIDRQRVRKEAPTLEQARAIAHLMLAENPKPVMIYAVKGVHDTYVETISCSC